MSRKTAPRIRIGQELEAALKPPGQGDSDSVFLLEHAKGIKGVVLVFNYHPMKFTHRNSQKVMVWKNVAPCKNGYVW